ncbi:PEP-CTERM sorting domain-containing protein [Massilia atriviolacea]|nr:PEP-CTERM sorting domain-containing protein [Massilia atriviolacea]
MKTLFAGAALLACLTPIQAAEQQFDWSFRYFGESWQSDSTVLDQTIKGTLTVDDVNADGRFDMSELKSLNYSGKDYVSCAGCMVKRFSFVPGGALDFNIEGNWYFDWGSTSNAVDVGRVWYESATYDWTGEPHYYSRHFVSQTVATVNAVPEPQTWLMLGAGLLALGAVVKRRKG